MLNMVLVQGNLTADPESKTANGGKFVTFSVAHNQGKGDKKKTTFVNCVVNEKLGEVIMKYFTKGKPIIVEGSLVQGKSLYVRVNSFHFVGGLDPKKAEPKPETRNDDDDIPF